MTNNGYINYQSQTLKSNSLTKTNSKICLWFEKNTNYSILPVSVYTVKYGDKQVVTL